MFILGFAPSFLCYLQAVEAGSQVADFVCPDRTLFSANYLIQAFYAGKFASDEAFGGPCQRKSDRRN